MSVLETPVREKISGYQHQSVAWFQMSLEEQMRAIANPELDIEEKARLLSQLDLPSEDGIPMETNWHRIAMNLLIDSVHALWRDRTDYFADVNMFIYFSLDQLLRKHYREPDVFVVNGVDGTYDRSAALRELVQEYS